MKACVTGATGFIGAHVAKQLDERGDEVVVAYRTPDHLKWLSGVDYRQAKSDVLDLTSMRKAVEGCDVVFHIAGFVGSSPADLVWDLNAKAPRVVVEAAAAEGVGRVVVTSSISAVGEATDDGPATEDTPYPEDGFGLHYPDSKRRGEEEALAAGEGFGVEVVIVNPGYALGAPIHDDQAEQCSARIIGSYLGGRLPAVADAPQCFVDVEDAACGHLLAADNGADGERYILGGHNCSWADLIDRVADLSGIRRPVLVFPRQVANVARMRERLGLPAAVAAEGLELMVKDWRFSSEKARRELGYEPRPLDETLRSSIRFYRELLEADELGENTSRLSALASGMALGGRFGLPGVLRLGERVAGRRFVAGA
ncbi:MAG: NAD-dependent epimerase/dehydratase family protein [Solirubrobacterales bacterium]